MAKKKKGSALDKVQARLNPSGATAHDKGHADIASRIKKGWKQASHGTVTYGVSVPDSTATPDLSDQSSVLETPAQKNNTKSASTTSTRGQMHTLSATGTLPCADNAEFEEQLEINDILHRRQEAQRLKRLNLIHRVCVIAIVCACVYMIFMIYGVFTTAYVYNDKGEVVPQIMSVAEIRNLKEFESISAEYLQARAVYEKVLLLDYRVGAELEDPLLIAPEYEAILTDIEELAIQVQALSPSPQYAQLVNMLTSWITNDIAIYCQRMSTAISMNNAEHAEQALEYKQISYNDFGYITQTMLTLGSNVTGADLSQLADWSPESYIQNTVGAYTNIAGKEE